MENDDEDQDNEDGENKSADAGRDNAADGYDVSSAMDKQYRTLTRENIRARKRKVTFPRGCAYT